MVEVEAGAASFGRLVSMARSWFWSFRAPMVSSWPDDLRAGSSGAGSPWRRSTGRDVATVEALTISGAVEAETVEAGRRSDIIKIFSKIIYSSP